MITNLNKKILLHVHMEVTRRLDRLYGISTSSPTHPSEFFSPYKGILDRHKEAHNKDVLSFLVYELLVEAARCGALYSEFKFNLLRWLEAGLQVEEVYWALNDGMEKAKEKTGIYSNAILCIRRDFTTNIVERLISIICEKKMTKLVGIDLAGDERKYPKCDSFRDTFLFAKRNGFKITIHAGEYGGPENVWFAIEKLHADRIGHGLSSVSDPNLLDYLGANKIMLEIALSSNQWSGITPKIENHPVRLFLAKGIPISINTDNPVLLDTDLSREFKLAYAVCGLSNDSLQRITYDSIVHSFAADNVKEKLLQEVRQGMPTNSNSSLSNVSDESLNTSPNVERLTKTSYDQNASGYADYYYGRNLMQAKIEEFLSFLPTAGPILDAGCGPGHDSNYIKSKGYTVTGIDISQGMIKEAKKRVVGVEFLERNMCHAWPEKERYFSGIWCCAALLHLTLQEAHTALFNFEQLLKPEGVIFLSVMRGHGDTIIVEDRPYGHMKRYFKFYEAEEFNALITSKGFDIIKQNEEHRWLSCIARKITT